MEARQEWLEEDYYAELGVNAGATADDITKAYRKLARELHPDTNPGDDAAEERFKRVSTAYDVLSDAEKRRSYDQLRRFGGPGGGRQGYTFDFDNGDASLDDLLGGMFGTAGPFTGGRRSGGTVFTNMGGRNAPARGADQEATLRLSFAEAATGFTTNVTVGDSSGSRDIKVRIPAGVTDGQQLRLRGQGGKGRGGAPDGDLLVKVNVDDHPMFGRSGTHLTVRVPISFPQAVLGGEVDVPTFDGNTVKLRIPAGTGSGRTFRVRDKGVRTDRETGDLLVTVDIEVPDHTTPEQAAALQAYAELCTERPDAARGAE
ncbi:MAG: J domain-containing protein [Acidimicrobiia bacterium]|nr:J domain-containing protein [Acidimicrobiia bacterium]